jgi:hypothetical protein
MKFDHISIEHGRGETYVTPEGTATVYGHDDWPESSVLAGRSRRTYLRSFDNSDRASNWAEAREWAEAEYPGVEVIDYAGSSHVPHREMLAHLPDDGEGWGDW